MKIISTKIEKNKEKIRILQFCSKPPKPLIDGGCVAMNAVSNLILNNENAALKIFCIATEKHPFLKDKMDEKYKAQTKIEAVSIKTSLNFFKYLLNIFKNEPYNIARFVHKKVDEALIRILESEQFDFVILESVFITSYINTIRKHSNAKILLRAHNVETALLKKRFENESIFYRLLTNPMLAKLKKQEIWSGKNVDGILAIGKGEAVFFKKYAVKTAITILPNPVIVDDEIYLTKNKKLKLFHIGAMDWQPNIEGIENFVNQVWNEKLAANFELHLAGKGLKKSKYSDKKGLYNYGFVESAKDFIDNCDIMIVPLKTASGVRIKILESMALGKPVITTKNGLLGIDAKPGLEVLVAITINDFNRILEQIAAGNINLKNISEKAKQFVKTNYSFQSIQNELFTFMKNI